MKRRDFLKLIGIAPIAPIAPSVLVAKPEKELTVAAVREFVKEADFQKYTGELMWIISTPTGYDHFYEMYCNAQNQAVGIALEDIPKNKYEWVNIYTTAQYVK